MFALFLHEDGHIHDDAADQDDVVNVRRRHLDQSMKKKEQNLFKKNLVDISTFCGDTDIPVLDYTDVCPVFQSQGGFPCLRALSLAHKGFLRFASDATPVDLLAAIMATEPLHPRIDTSV